LGGTKRWGESRLCSTGKEQKKKWPIQGNIRLQKKKGERGGLSGKLTFKTEKGDETHEVTGRRGSAGVLRNIKSSRRSRTIYEKL